MKSFIYLLISLIIMGGCLDRPQTKGLEDGNISSLDSNSSIVEVAKKHLGKPYKYGQSGPDSFDCSGFVYGVHRSVGINIPRTSIAQSKIGGDKLSKEELKVGDMLFFDTSLRGHVNHSGIYLGNGKFIHASSGKANSVTISDMNGWYRDKFMWGKRIKKR